MCRLPKVAHLPSGPLVSAYCLHFYFWRNGGTMYYGLDILGKHPILILALLWRHPLSWVFLLTWRFPCLHLGMRIRLPSSVKCLLFSNLDFFWMSVVSFWYSCFKWCLVTQCFCQVMQSMVKLCQNLHKSLSQQPGSQIDSAGHEQTLLISQQSNKVPWVPFKKIAAKPNLAFSFKEHSTD